MQIQSTHAAFLPANDPSASDNWPQSSLLQESVRLSWHKANTPKQQKAQKIWVALGNYIWPKIYDTQWKTPWWLWLIPNPWPEKNSADRRTVLQIQPKYEEACFPKLLNKCNLKHFICSTAIARTVNLVCAALCFTIYWSNLIRGICNWIDVNPYSFFLSGYFTNTRMYFFFFSFFSWW